mgnify:CR=1 FL=1
MRWELPLPVVVLGGIYSGFFAVSEAAAITALFVLVVEVGIYREIAFKELPRITRDAMVMVGGILLILAVSLAFRAIGRDVDGGPLGAIDSLAWWLLLAAVTMYGLSFRWEANAFIRPYWRCLHPRRAPSAS